MRGLPALLLALAVACSAGPAPSARSSGETVRAVVGRGPSLTVSPSASPSVGATPVRDEPRAILDAYLDALARQDFTRALATSTGAAHRLALVRLVLSRHNVDRGATTTVSLMNSRFPTASRTARRVSFEGSATLRSTVAKAGETPEVSVRTIADPVVERVGTAWRVSGFRWEGRPMVAVDGGAVVRLQGLEVRLEGSLAFGEVVGVVVLLLADGERTVRVDDDRLRAGEKEAAAGFRSIVGGQPGVLYLSYPRIDRPPTAWRARISIDGARAEEVVLSFG